MCGIVGRVGRQGTDMLSALAAIQHRGPDGQGAVNIQVADVVVQLGHTRLAILDLTEAGHQPMWSRDRRWCITFNGEIYNHLELRHALNGTFAGHSDTETLVEYIARHGLDNTLNQLNGMFAFAALDTQERRLYLVRDRFGIKTIYFNLNESGLAFASEVRALKALGAVSGQVDQNSLQSLLTLRYVPSPATLWRDVRRLGPGEVLRLDLTNNRSEFYCFAQPTTAKFNGSKSEAVAEYMDVLSRAIDRQMLSDVPVGILLSGGIDSALIAAMAKAQGHTLSAYTVGFGADFDECEIDAASHTARTLGLRNKTIQVSAEHLRSVMAQTITQIEEPLGTVSVLPMWHLCQLAKKSVSVVLSGQGSDEPWGGYRRYQLEILRSKLPWSRLWKLLQFVDNGKRHDRLPDFIRKSLRALPIADRAQRYAASYELFCQEDRTALLGSASDGGAAQTVQKWLDWLAVADTNKAERMLRVDTRMNLSDDLLLYTDKISMAYALEVRVPMLDMKVVEFVESLPLDFRVTVAKSKIVHRAMATAYLPGEIVHRPKQAFQIPLKQWLQVEWRAWAESILFDSNSKIKEFINPAALKVTWLQHVNGIRDNSTQLFTLISLAIWLDTCR